MSRFKLFILFLCCLNLGRISAAVCEKFSEAQGQFEICWDETWNAWVSKSCLTSNCDATLLLKNSFPKIERSPRKSSRNPLSDSCKFIEANLLILRDSRQNEYTFCVLKDKSLIDASAVERKIF